MYIFQQNQFTKIHSRLLTMKAVVVRKFGPPENLQIERDFPKPEIKVNIV